MTEEKRRERGGELDLGHKPDLNLSPDEGQSTEFAEPGVPEEHLFPGPPEDLSEHEEGLYVAPPKEKFAEPGVPESLSKKQKPEFRTEEEIAEYHDKRIEDVGEAVEEARKSLEAGEITKEQFKRIKEFSEKIKQKIMDEGGMDIEEFKKKQSEKVTSDIEKRIGGI